MIVQVDQTLALEVYFDLADREEGYEDDIYFGLKQSGPKEMWLFPADETGFLLTADQAERLASALMRAAAASRSAPR